MFSDIRFAFRSLARNRVFTLVTVLTLALGIGSAASIFSVTDWILFRANRFPDDVYAIGGQSEQNPFTPFRLDSMVRAYQEHKGAIAEFAKATRQQGNIVVEGLPVGTMWMGITSNLMPMLGLTPRQGRNFLPGEDAEGANNVVIVSHWFWKSKLGGANNVLGRKLLVGDAVCTVVGVLGQEQRLPNFFNAGLYRPLVYRTDPKNPWYPWLFLLGKLELGVTREQAEAALRTVKVDGPANLREFLDRQKVALAGLVKLDGDFHKEIYWVILGAVGFLYAIACLNASNFMLVRMLGQRRELCVRLALGGGRGRIVRLLAIESVTLAVFASFAGLFVANWFFPMLLSATGSPGAPQDWTSWTLGWRVIGVMSILTVVTSLAIVILPAIRVFRTDIAAGLKDGGAALGESPTLARLRGTLVVLQAAFAVVLLAGAGLMIRTFANFQKVDFGFDPVNLAKIYIDFPQDYTQEWEPNLLKRRELQSVLMRIPGVIGVGFGNDLLLQGYHNYQYPFHDPSGRTFQADVNTFNTGFQEVAGLKLRRGRWLTESRGDPILVNESFARLMFPGKDPIGQYVKAVGSENDTTKPKGWEGWQIAGVVADIRMSMREAPGYAIYGPEGWNPAGMNTLVVKLGVPYTPAVSSQLQRQLYAFDSRMMVHWVAAVSESRDNQLWEERMANSVLKVLAGTALLLTVVGMFSVLAYTVDRRMGEFGVRMALGATRRDLVQLVLKRGVLLAVLGTTAGVAAALYLTKFLKTMLYEVPANDPWVLAVVGMLLVATSVLACALPARRATKVDITKLLRSE
jgi:predicted permease